MGIQSIGIRRIGLHGPLNYGSSLSSSSSHQWTDAEYILTSGAIWYKREINNAEGWFKLWYSSNAGATYNELMNLDLTEDIEIIDLAHEYVHHIVGTSYRVDTAEGVNLYAT